MATKRQGLSTKIRFEVFKRDSFTCQYCGKSAPEIVLHVDHITPVSKGGANDITNLITSCQDCNLGKKDRELSDNAVVQKRKKQLDELQERREQLEMMVEWQYTLMEIETETLDKAAAFWSDILCGFSQLTEHGMAEVKKLIRRYGLSETMESMRLSCDQYVKWQKDPENEEIKRPELESVQSAFYMVARICASRRVQKDKPYMKDLYYMRGIMRKRYSYVNEWQALDILEKAYDNGHEIEEIKKVILSVKNWSAWRDAMQPLLAA